MGRLAELHKEYAGTGVQFLGVVADVLSWKNQLGEDAANIISKAGAGYPHLGSTVELISGISYVPSTLIYDGNGNLIVQLTGEHSRQDWINIIETLMANQ